MSDPVSFVASRLRAEASHPRNIAAMRELVEVVKTLEAMTPQLDRQQLLDWLDARSRRANEAGMEGFPWGRRLSFVLDVVAEELLRAQFDPPGLPITT